MIVLSGLVVGIGIARCGEAQTTQFGIEPDTVTFTKLSGEDLVKLCKGVETDESSHDSMLCLMYLSGYSDGYGIGMLRFNHEKQSAFCPPTQVTRIQTAKIVMKYGNDHPSDLPLSAALFTAVSLKNAYPCKE